MSTARALAALMSWGGAETPPCLVAARENNVYDVRLAGGSRAALRLHRAGYQSAESVSSELGWMQALTQAGVAVPAPVPTLSGRLVHSADGVLASMVAWVDGRPIGTASEALSGTPSEQAALFRTIGQTLAAMHEASDRAALPGGFCRHRWDEAGLIGETPLWGRFWENPALAPPERALILRARERARGMLAEYRTAGGDFGLIHADLLRENLLTDGERVTLIDFDDAGWGFRLYDLGTLMIQNRSEPGYDCLLAAVVAGYRTVRPLPDRDVALVPMFVMLRAFASMGWVMPRLRDGDPQIRAYSERALDCAAGFLS